MAHHVRPAQPADHAVFVRLFPELEVDDPILDREQFVHRLLPTTLIAEVAEASEPTASGGVLRAVGYAYFLLMKDMAYVAHVVTAPEARRTGVARSLLAAVVDRARAAGCSTWCLNVKPGNAAAIALYEGLGMRRAHASRALDMAWRAIEAGAAADASRRRGAGGRADHVPAPQVTARDILPEDDARVESAMALIDGQLATARGVGGRVLKVLEEHDGRVVGAAIFNPDFPGAFPFRVARPELAVVLLRALRPHAQPAHTTLHVVTEGQPDVAEALIAAGATVKLEILHMKGPLPPPLPERA